ncbi:MAG: putative PilT domain containing protein [Candidatus Saccharibacteria bacterium]|nr:putative PilT domain containing protein [Candidatus Saccharibacteria bacterium]
MELLIICALLVIAAETTYLVVAQTIKFKHSKKQHMPIFVDTSVLIDGRIISIAESGFITSTLFIPRSVVGELQFLADNADTEKRSRARHGLDIVKELQAMANVKVEIFNDGTKAEEGVDNRLLKLAKEYNGAICTIDFNLNKVAQVEGIPVLNVNDLAKTLRMAYLPGEKIKLELTQKGNDQHQAIGHLDDGTMVVVEHASSQIGKIVEIEFIRGLQTAAGKMMFARLVGGGDRDLAKKAAQTTKRDLPKVKLPRQKAVRTERIQPQVAELPQEAPVATPAVDVLVQPSRPKRPQQPRYNKPAGQTAQVDTPQQAPRKNNGRQNNRRRTPEDSLFELLDKQE